MSSLGLERGELIRQRIPTESFDDNGEPSEDPRWAPFRVFQDWMKDTFSQAFVISFDREVMFGLTW
jgi:hypothetical protein